nr:hypothetical protein [Tanacetum cinerariifolium]
MAEIRELHAADRRRQIVISEMLKADHRRSTEIIGLRTALQGQVAALQGQKQLAPKRTTRSTADQETTNTTSITNAQLEVMIDQGVTAALAARDALRSTNGDDSHNSGTGVRRTERATREFGHDVAYGMPWKTLMKMMTDKYSPRNEIKKLEMEIWDLKVKGTDLASYTQRFQELALLCGRMFSEESDKIEKYIRDLLDMIHGSVVASKPKTIQAAVEIETELMDKKIRTFAERETARKRKFKNTSRNTQNQQQQLNKRQNTGQVYTVASGEKKQYGGSKPYALNAIITMTVHVLQNATTATKLAILPVTVGIWQIPIMLTIRGALGQARNLHVNTGRVYTAASGERKEYAGTLPLCNKCKFHHNGRCIIKNPTCYEYGNQGHYRSDFPELKNQDHGNQAGGTGAHGMVHALKGGETNQDPNDVEDDINA